MLVLDCSHPENREVHMTPTDCNNMANKSMSKRILLVHMGPSCTPDIIKKQCKFKNKIIAKDLMKINI
ncbi:MAG: hypothetical protein HZB65_04825 [Candidatus Aenigmarchaeota archaeon]|nr:hypothetical protein [Candidatus Aenigmarchaeota archaeon]